MVGRHTIAAAPSHLSDQMTHNSPTKKRVWRQRVLWASGISVSLVVVWLAINIRPLVRTGSPLVTVSLETTGIVSPLDSNGDVDYLLALNQIASNGVTPENNAMVKIILALGPNVEGPIPGEFFDRLGMAPPPIDGNYFVSFPKWLERNGSSNRPDASEDPFLVLKHQNQLAKQFDFAFANPWSSDTCPELAEWREQQSNALALIRDGITQPQYYQPMISSRIDDVDVLSVKNVIASQLQVVAVAMSVDAMWHLHNGDVDASFNEAFAVYRLARHLNTSPQLIDGVTAVSLHTIADSIVVSICLSGKATENQLTTVLEKLNSIQPPLGCSRRLKTGSQFLMLDTVRALGRGDISFSELTVSADQQHDASASRIDKIGMNMVDASETMKVVKSWSDRYIDASNLTTWPDRRDAYARLDDDMQKLIISVSDPIRLARTFLAGRGAKGRLLADRIVTMLRPLVIIVETSEQHGILIFNRAKIAVALAAFQKKNGYYPANLDLLIPEHFTALPQDGFGNGPFKYKTSKNAFELYSVGENGIDENGLRLSPLSDDWKLDDALISWDDFINEQP